MKLNEYKLLSKSATGKTKSEIVLKNGRVINVFTNKIELCDIAICKGVIVGVGEYEGYLEIDLDGKYVSPGFFDAHIHMESSMVTPPELIKNIIKWGTTSYIEDPHEAANVKGRIGVDYMLSQTSNLPANVYLMLPSCVPSLDFETNGSNFNVSDMRRYIKNPRILGLGEVMNYPAVINASRPIHRKLNLFSEKIIDGHAPNLSEYDLSAYALSGISTDHECSSFQYALMQISKGIHVHIRHGSAAKNLDNIVKGIVKSGIPTDCFSFCTDDKHIEDIKKEGHISYCIKRSIELGIDPVSAIKMATINTANCYNLKHLGAIAPGYQADLVIFDNFEDFNILDVYHKGKNVNNFKWKKILLEKNSPLKNTINVRDIYKRDFSMRLDGSKKSVINLIENEIMTKHTLEYLPEKNGFFKPNRNYNKIAIVERHKSTGLIGLGAVKSFGIVNGAIASSVSHDSHNISVIGDNNIDMLIAVLELQKVMGGLTIVSSGRVLKTLPLPVMGIMSEYGFNEVDFTLKEMIKLAHDMGVYPFIDPFVTLSFISLPVIPEIRITPKGLFDVVNMKFIKQ